MKNVSFSSLLKSKAILDHHLSRLGLTVRNDDRFHRAYSIVAKFDSEIFRKIGTSEYKDAVAQFKSEFPGGEPLHALFDIQDLYHFLPYANEVDDVILRSKLKKIMADNVRRDMEHEGNPIARNTQFELLLFGLFRKAGISAEMCEPRPDIKAVIGDRTYWVECKRLLRENDKVNTRVKEGLKQLNSEMGRSDDPEVGVLALSVQRMIIDPENVLRGDTADNILSVVSEWSKGFVERNKHTWQNEARLRNRDIGAIWLVYSGGAIMNQAPGLAGIYNTLMTNAWPNGGTSFEQVRKDFADMVGLLEAADE